MRARILLGLVGAATLAAGILGNSLVQPETPLAAVAGPSVRQPDARVSIQTELVTAPTVASARERAAQSTPPPRARRASPRRSLFARVLLGSGENRPQPFPHPAVPER